MRELRKVLNWKFWGMMLIFGLLIPWVFKQGGSSAQPYSVIISLFILNSIFSVYAGSFLRKNGSFWYLLIVWPLIFLFSVWLGYVPAIYGYSFAVLYFVLSIFAYTAGQEDDVDIEKQIPIDGGIKDV